jgi:RIO kinase 1
MEFVGENLRAAPRLVDVKLSKEEADEVQKRVLNNINIFLEFGIVHGDLSEYNILWWKQEIYIIDFPQAIDIRNNPQKDMLIRRDIDNVLDFLKEKPESYSPMSKNC